MSGRRVLVVGSGPSGVHFAQTALDRGYEVTMVDVGHAAPPHIMPGARFDQLKQQLDDPVAFFLGPSYESVMLPGPEREYYGIPASKRHVFEAPEDFGYSAEGFAPLFSFARGGLAEVWTAGCYPFNEGELVDFPFASTALEPYYDEVARRIGITGEVDDLARFMPVHAHLLSPLPFDSHSALLAHRYGRKRHLLNTTLGAYLGRTRVATLTRDMDGRRACETLGRCLWGCPLGALYTPSETLRALERMPGFRYLSGHMALHFIVAGNGRITGLVTRCVGSGETQTFPVEQLALATGTLSTAAIVLRSVRAATGESVRLHGLMDNRQVLVPFLNLRMLGRPYDEGTYQYHLLALGLQAPDPRHYVHGQITTLKAALMHPIIKQLPFDLRTSLAIARTTHAALGVVNVNFHDWRRDENWLDLEERDHGVAPRLRIHYAPAPDEPSRMRATLSKIRRVLWHLGCIVPPGMQHVRPMGTSVHYAGVLPMTATGGRWTADARCRSREFPNLLLVDGSTFPFLPAKNLTFTLMANATRVAAEAL